MASASATSVGVSPAMTSSSMSRRGPAASARATSSRFRPPIVRSPAMLFARAARSTSSRMARACSRARRFERSERAPKRQPTATFSSTVMPAKGRTIWKVRATPRRLIWSGRRPSIRSPSKRMRPSVGRSLPAIRLNSVVLPAPLAPITPTVSPDSTDRDTSDSAMRPPKALLTPWTSRSMVGQPPARGDPLEDAAGYEKHEHDEQDAEQDHVDLRRVGPEQFGEQGQEGGAEQGAARIVRAADDGDRDDGERDHRVEGLHRIEIAGAQDQD